ncbi:MAG: alpha-ketoacid dehydrogenase subunit beta [Fimbriimonadaceae bacterium]|nr:alpha-ketoacid dehydrogenase subunit beta [Fimbriimonadaceae bacterium]QYK57516.1 MAG: alpha-ketoacid dehydrogenase subunit beta [Fimbriimonadaceae bacterium]
MPTIETTYRDAIHRCIDEEMTRNPDVFVIGEDIGRYEGTFKVTKGLWPKYGEKRVVDTPITEPGFTGLAIGAAMVGLRPIVEMMTMSFSILALDQIINHAAKIHSMTGGQATVPLVVRGPGGAAKQLSAQHSHSMEGWYAHVPGLKVVAPATVEDAYGMLKTAIWDDNPVIFTENPGLYTLKGTIPDNKDFSVPFGKCQVLREGSDLTLVGYSRMTRVNLEAADKLAEKGVSAEVVDVRSLLPLDTETIFASVAKTHRAIVVYEDWRSGGFGAEIAARIGESCFDDLDAPVVRVGGLNVPMPYARVLELECIPDVDDVIAAVDKLG